MAGASAWLTTKYAGSAATAPRQIQDPGAASIMDSITSEPLAPIVVGLGVVILGLIMERVLVAMKK